MNVPAAQLSAFVLVRCVVSVFSLFLVVYFLSRKMATEELDFFSKSIGHEEYKTSTWRNDPLTFARSERRCATLHKRNGDDTLETTKFAMENVMALMVGDKISHSFSWRRKWEIDFVRFLLGFTTQREEVEFSRMTEDQMKLCTVEHSVTKLIGKGMTNILHHRTWFKDEMDAKGAIPMNLLLDNLRGRQSPTDQCAAGRIFASLLNGNDKQRFYVDIYLSDVWYPQREHMPWSIYIGCHQGHSTGLVMPAQVSHPLTPVECFALGSIFHTTDRRFQDSIYQKGLVRRGRDALHFMYENDGGKGYIQKGAGTREPRRYDSTIYVVLNIPMMLYSRYDLFLTANGVVLVIDDLPIECFTIVGTFPHLTNNIFNPIDWSHTSQRSSIWILETRSDSTAEVHGILVIRRDIQVPGRQWRIG